MKKCDIPSCTEQINPEYWCCITCFEWLASDKKQWEGESFKESTERREAHLQSLKVAKTPKCEVNDCDCEADEESVKYNWSAKLCQEHTQEYYDTTVDSAGQFVKMKNTTKKQPIELLIQPLGSIVKVEGKGIKWGFSSVVLSPTDATARTPEQRTIYIDPNAQGTLRVTHTTPKGEFYQYFSFGEHQYRKDVFKAYWSQCENYNDPISDSMMKRLKPIELSNDDNQLLRLGESLGKAAGNMGATGQAIGVAMKTVKEGEMVSADMIRPNSFTNFKSDPIQVNVSPDLFNTCNTAKGFPRLTAEQIRTIQKSIDLQPINGFIPTEKLPIDNCDDTPNTYEVTEMTITNDEEKQTMNTKELYTAPVLKEDLTDAGIRLAGRQFTKATRDVVAAAIAGHAAPGDNTLRAKVADFLKTDLGEALLQSFLSIGLSSLPESTGAIPALLARELRVSSMTGAGDVFADLLMGPLRQVTSTLIQGMPKPPTAALEAQSQNVVKVNVPVSVEAEVNR